MINTRIIHPEILEALAAAGHGSTILIADGNFPMGTAATKDVPRVYLNLAPDMLKVSEVLKCIVDTIPIEAAVAPGPDDGSEPPIFPEYRAILPEDIKVQKVNRFDFYDAVKTPELALMIGTGEKRPFACILLTVGVRKF